MAVSIMSTHLWHCWLQAISLQLSGAARLALVGIQESEGQETVSSLVIVALARDWPQTIALQRRAAKRSPSVHGAVATHHVLPN